MLDALILLLLGAVIASSIYVLVRDSRRGAQRRSLTAAQLNFFGPTLLVMGVLALTAAGAAAGLLIYISLGGLGHAAYAGADESSTRELLLSDLEALAPPGATPGELEVVGCDDDGEVRVHRTYSDVDSPTAVRHFHDTLPALGWSTYDTDHVSPRLSYDHTDMDRELKLALPEGAQPLHVWLTSSEPCMEDYA